MPKKSKRQQANEANLIVWYKWEFLRRNLTYRKDYEAFIGEFGNWFRIHGYWYDQTVTWNRKELEFFAKVIAPKVKAICERWQIREPSPPSWSGRNNRPGILVPTDCSKEEAGQGWDLPQFLLSRAELRKLLPESTVFRCGPDPDYQLELEFDLRRPLESLLREATDQITSRKRRYDRTHLHPTSIAPAVRRRLDRYAVYLKVWDLRKSGMKFDSIGALLFPGEPGATALQRAKDSFGRAQELIHDGYKELR